ncbi:hypothetical protein EGW08_005654 [Elysia chlorotica]|uniref:Uncharacterized protein n=1 Tax=Elysia chlorotica TaxID=188477 RepID=A0A433TYA6_ELYCH|nr:hypothetical protein EGW08_005654 [Elysia chlorotica]
MTSPKGDRYHEQDVQHLFRAIRRGKAHLTRFMLAASNNVLLNCWDADGKTPLIECCYIKEEATRDKMVRILKEAGADVNMADRDGRTPLIHACEQRCNDIVRILTQHCNISPDMADRDGNTALIHAAFIGNDIALEILVRHFRRLGLQVDHYNQAGYTALHIAAKSGFLQCAKILAVKGKASLTIKDKVHGLTPLDWSLKEGYQKSEVEFLKPSAKFYRLAKLTTTMAKYRKRSSVTSQDSLPQIPDTAKPVRTVDKAKGKVKNLLKKSPQIQDDSEFMAIGAGCVPKPGKSGATSKNPFSKSSAVDSSKTKSTDKKQTSKASRQRSFTLSGNKDAAPKHKPLQHSISHPCPSKSDADTTQYQENHRGPNVPKSLAFYKDKDFHDELGARIDTDEESSCSDTESVSLMESLDKSPRADSKSDNSDNNGWSVYCGEASTSSDADRTSYGVLSLSQYTEAGVYCGDIKSNIVADDSVSTKSFPSQSVSQEDSEVRSPSFSMCLQSPITEESFSCIDSYGPKVNGKNLGNNQTIGYKHTENMDKDEGSQSESSFSSLLTTIEFLGNTGPYKKVDPTPLGRNIDKNAHETQITRNDKSRQPLVSTGSEISDLDDCSSLHTEVTDIAKRVSKLEVRNRDLSSGDAHRGGHSQQMPDSPETSASCVSDSTEITEVIDCLPNSSSQQLYSLSQTQSKSHKSMSERRSSNDYLDLSSSAVYSRRLQTKTNSSDTATSKTSQNDETPQSSCYESIRDDPVTDYTFIQETKRHHLQDNTTKPLPLNSQNDRVYSSVERNAPIKEKTMKEEDKILKARKPTDSFDKNKNDNTKIEHTQSGKEQTPLMNAKVTPLRITPNKNRLEDHYNNPIIDSISQNSKSTHGEARLVNSHMKEQRKDGEELSSVRIGQYTSDTKHIETIT